MALAVWASSAAMATIMDGEATPAQIGALLAAMAARGETEDEVVGFARTMRARAVPLTSSGAVDTCGTGGDGAGTFNISTVASFVVAACGVPVAKHGNRSASGTCGSADVLEALGVRIDAPPAVVQAALDTVGWTFLFAPKFHASTRHALAPRRELGVRTAFNLLGPLTNPARPSGQVVGVPRPELTSFVARCLQRLGTRRAWVVNGSGLDELTPEEQLNAAGLVLNMPEGQGTLLAPGHQAARHRHRFAVKAGEIVEDGLGVMGTAAARRVRVEPQVAQGGGFAQANAPNLREGIG